jgi:hypothetical protein
MTTAIVITARGVSGSFRAVGAQLGAAAIKGLQRAAYDLHARAVREVEASKPRPPVDIGQLKRSFRVQPTPDGAVVDNTSPQAVWMEYGTRPHWAPLSPLLAWAQRKARGGNIRSAYALAKGTQLAIAKRGTAPRHFWQRSLKALPDIVRKRLEEALGRASAAA